MADMVLSTSKGKKSKKLIRQTIQDKLSVTLADYRSVIGEKRFESCIRKAARLIGQDILKALPKKNKKANKIADEKSS